MKKNYVIPEAEELHLELEAGLLYVTGGDDDIPAGVMQYDPDED